MLDPFEAMGLHVGDPDALQCRSRHRAHQGLPFRRRQRRTRQLVDQQQARGRAPRQLGGDRPPVLDGAGIAGIATHVGAQQAAGLTLQVDREASAHRRSRVRCERRSPPAHRFCH
ncbi:hypothetical protein QFW77_17020 [Luteimonas sp. RD2P54]|uniref:Uncharacterized protein n=1 Tax=Luteimonas endophytica TaxID=3042023 RepID=A0ABT6JDL7_9GAMM|nr:hypothetical protein [Luteimonas endophytica]MDH5824675.1 hypothetical protein [Luteimonas endophytica]